MSVWSFERLLLGSIIFFFLRLMTKWLLDWREAWYSPDFPIVPCSCHTTSVWHSWTCLVTVTSVRNLSKIGSFVVRMSCNRSAIHAPSKFGPNYAWSLCDIIKCANSMSLQVENLSVFKQFCVSNWFPTVVAKRIVHFNTTYIAFDPVIKDPYSWYKRLLTKLKVFVYLDKQCF